VADLFDLQALCSSNHKNVIAEALGCPGVGKSYVCVNYANEAFNNGLPMYYHSIDKYPRGWGCRMLYKLGLIIGHLGLQIGVVRSCVKIVCCFRYLKIRHKLKVLLNLLLISAVIMRHRRRSTVLLLDQGIAQAIWSCLYYHIGEVDAVFISKVQNNVVCLLMDLGLDQISILSVSADESTIMSRLSSRDNHRTSPLDTLEVSALAKGLDVTNITSILFRAIAEIFCNCSVYSVVNSDTA
jgi:hypothetical protein